MTLKVIGEHDENTIAQAKNVLRHGADKFILCADGHLGYGHPIGGVAAYKDHISISGVGYDIACGNMAVKLPVKLEEVRAHLPSIAEGIRQRVSFGVGRVNATKVEAEFLDTADWSNEAIKGLKDLAANQLGTVGSGNHYVDVFHDEDGFIWVGVHFGSRGLGHKATTHFLNRIDAKDDMNADPALVALNSDIGQSYLEAMNLGGQYAYAGREWVCKTVAELILGEGKAEYLHQVHNHHNFSFLEEHDGEKYHVVRKGATPAFPGQQCFVGGSMGDISVILEGLDTPAAKENLYSTVHGAGRVLSRRQAAGKTKWQNGQRVTVKAGLVDENEMRKTIDTRGTILLGGGADEAPQCYRKLESVLEHHKDSVRVCHTLQPLIVAMAGANEFDPYKD